MPPHRSFHDPELMSLLLEAQAGSATALAELLVLIHPYLLLIANTDTPASVRAGYAPSDFAQDAVMKGLEKFEQFSGETPEKLAGWLRQVLKNRIHDETRKPQPPKPPGPDDSSLDGLNTLPDPAPTPDDVVMMTEERERAVAAFGRLRPHYAQVLILRVRDELSFEEIGQRLGKRSDAARMLYSAAKKQFKQLVEPSHAP